MVRDYDRDRLEHLALYIASRSVDDPKFGKTKLAKILFFSDFGAYTDLGDSITGADYQKWPKGPFPPGLNSAIKRIEKRGDGAIAVGSYFGKDQQRLVAVKPVDISDFTPEEISLVDEVIGIFKDDDAASVSEFSHQEPAWMFVDDMSTIPYDLAWVGAGEPPSDVVKVGQDVAARLGLLSA